MSIYKHHASNMLFGIVIGFALAIGGIAIAGKHQPTQANNELPLKDVQRFTTAISQIKNYYVEPVSDEKLFQDAIRGMLSGLDPHSSYLDIEEFKSLTDSTQGKFSGLGIEVTMEHGLIKVITPIDDSPADKAGVQAGDLIVKLNELPLKGLTLRQAVDKMRGDKGTSITLTILRKGEKKPLIVEVTRDVIRVLSVKSRILENGYGYIRISQFQTPSAKLLNEAVTKLNKQAKRQLQGLVLDLRNNPGGLLDAAIEVSDTFLDSNTMGKNKKIVYTKGRYPSTHYTAHATPGDVLNGAPMVVLINKGSASGSEIVAGALQDHKRAILLGRSTFGKGSVQTVLPLDDKTGVKLTTARYYTPLGRSIQAEGIKPDIKLIDVNIKKPKDAEDTLDPIIESNLNGHLENESNNGKPASKSKSQANTEELVFTDYPLHQALMVLKGLSILKKS